MRINVYSEELTVQTGWVTKEANGKRFYGLRLYLKSHPDLHDTPNDDDRSAITFWGPFHDKEESGVSLVAMLAALQCSLEDLMQFRIANPHI